MREYVNNAKGLGPGSGTEETGRLMREGPAVRCGMKAEGVVKGGWSGW